MRSTCSLLALLLATPACSDGARDSAAAREALIIDTLVAADRDLADERGDLVAAKYALMATGPQPFLRGTAALFYRDYARQRPVARGDGADLVQLYGDPHLENAGAWFDDGGMLLEATDFDATVPGPFDWDVRRAGLGVAVALGEAAASDEVIDAAADALAAGYLDMLVEEAPQPRRAPASEVWIELLAEADGRRARRDELARYTELTDGKRRLRRDADTREIAAPFADGLADAIARYRATRRGGTGDPAAFALKDAAQRFGSGVASLPNVRLWLLLEGPPGEEDDLLLELKEERDPPLPLDELGTGPRAASNGARVAAGFSRLASTPTLEPDGGWVDHQGLSFQVRSITRGRENLDVADLAADRAADRYDDADLVVMARELGQLLSAGHARTADRRALLAAIGAPHSFRRDTARAALADHRQIINDLELFRAALHDRGPLLRGPQ